MTSGEHKLLKECITMAVNQAMQEVHRQWSAKIPVEELRIEVCRILTDRAFECALEVIKKSPQRRIKKLLDRLEMAIPEVTTAEPVVEPVAGGGT